MGQLRRDGVALAYEEAGSGAPPILLVHDLGSDHTSFASQFEYLRRSHRVVAVDLRGHGQSDKPEGAYTVALLADDLAWLCYELGLYRPVVLGHGLGGMVALDLAARYRDLPSAIVVVARARAGQAMPAAAAQLPFSHHEVVPLLENISIWAHVAATRGCSVPVLYVDSAGSSWAGQCRRRSLPDGMKSARDGTTPCEDGLLPV